MDTWADDEGGREGQRKRADAGVREIYLLNSNAALFRRTCSETGELPNINRIFFCLGKPPYWYKLSNFF
jgi:hypothetical protein